jgi:hypothetical protein
VASTLEEGSPGTPPATEAPAFCTKCSGPLSVGERMFYFLDSDSAPALCRDCLAGSEEGELVRSWDSLEVISWHRVDAPTASDLNRSDGANDLTRAVRAYLQDEFDRADIVLDRVPSDHPDLALARSLRAETQQLLFSNQLAEAVALLRDLRRVLVGLEGGRRRAPLAAPWDESVEEMFDRVQARSTAMVRGAQTSPDVDGSDLEVAVPERRRRPSASS